VSIRFTYDPSIDFNTRVADTLAALDTARHLIKVTLASEPA
jgi:hypothetical protein